MPDPRSIRTTISRLFKEQDKRKLLLRNSSNLADQAKLRGLLPKDFRNLLLENYNKNKLQLDQLLETTKSQEFLDSEKLQAFRAKKIKWKNI